MGSSIFTNYEEIAAVLLFVIGLMNLLMQPNLVKKIIGLYIMDCAIYLFLAAKGYIQGRMAPIYVAVSYTHLDVYKRQTLTGLVLLCVYRAQSVTEGLLAVLPGCVDMMTGVIARCV